MNSFNKTIIVIYILGYGLLTLLYYLEYFSQLFYISTLYAGILNLLNSYAAVKLFDLSYKSGSTKFLLYNLGGIGIRLMLLLIIFVIVIKFLNIDKYGFILVFFIFYFISLVLEVIFYLKTVKKIT